MYKTKIICVLFLCRLFVEECVILCFFWPEKLLANIAHKHTYEFTQKELLRMLRYLSVNRSW